MSGPILSPQLRAAVAQRAGQRCEYCHLLAQDTLLPHEPDHIIARQHGGTTTLNNLALACFECNRLKGPNLASVDPETGVVLPLFHPRRDRWADHFSFDGVRLVPLTAIGRATASLLKLNAAERLRLRQALRQIRGGVVSGGHVES